MVCMGFAKIKIPGNWVRFCVSLVKKGKKGRADNLSRPPISRPCHDGGMMAAVVTGKNERNAAR